MYVETLIVFLPVLFFFMVTLQLIELWTGSIVARHAAWMAARAASVVLPDDPAFYGGVPVNSYQGRRREEVTQAARSILAAKSQFDAGGTSVEVEGEENGGPLRVTVNAPFRCFAPFVNVVCGGGSRNLIGRATHVYHGANYAYE